MSGAGLGADGAQGTEAPVWRSILFVPADRDDFVAKAHARGADAIQLDLEDGVAPGAKAAAREALPGAIDVLAARGQEVIVRANRPWRLLVRDLEAAVRPNVRAVTLPKVPDAAHVRAAADCMAELEAERGLAPGSVRLVAMIETADAFGRMAEIAVAHRRLAALILGTEDFAAECGMVAEPGALDWPVRASAVAARAAGLLPLGFADTIAEMDPERLGAAVRRAYGWGLRGAFCVHPAQVAVLNRAFSPTAEEVARARRVVEAFDEAAARGKGAVAVDGRMVDAPVAARARETLRLAERLGRAAEAAE